MKQEGRQNTDWNDTGNSKESPADFPHSNSQVPEYPLPCDTEIPICDDDYPQVVARMPKINPGWFAKTESRTTIRLSRIFKTQRLLVLGLVAVFVSAGLLGTAFYFSRTSNQALGGASSFPADQASVEGTSSQDANDNSIAVSQTAVDSGLFASPVISSENEKSVLASTPAENQTTNSWIQSGEAASSFSEIPAIESPVSSSEVPAVSSNSLPVSVPQASGQVPAQASSSIPVTVPSQAGNPGWSDLSSNSVTVSETHPVTQYTAGKPVETAGPVGEYAGTNQTKIATSPSPADIRLVSGQNNSVPNTSYSARVIDENGQDITSTPNTTSVPMGNATGSTGMPMAAQPYNANVVATPHPYPNANPYPQNSVNPTGAFSVPSNQVPSMQTGQEPVRVAANPYSSNQTYNPQPSIPAYTPNPNATDAAQAPVTVTTGMEAGSVIATPMGQIAPAQGQGSVTPFVAGENGFRGYSVDTGKQSMPTSYSSNPYLEKTDRIR